MNLAIKAIYEEGMLRPLEPLKLAEHTVVRISLETAADDSERREWLAQGGRTLMNIWDNEADDIYNALLTK
jgi:predicted DNA-binding antitoxin AbrB/MazE fold protein